MTAIIGREPICTTFVIREGEKEREGLVYLSQCCKVKNILLHFVCNCNLVRALQRGAKNAGKTVATRGLRLAMYRSPSQLAARF